MLRQAIPFIACLLLVSAASASPPPAEEDPWAGHLELLNELSERRRSNTFFVNEQSTLHGLQIGHVNLATGNLTFLRRDLVTAGRLPIVAGRVYDSGAGRSTDFGPGWRLTFDESLEQTAESSWIYTDESGSQQRITRGEQGWRWSGDELKAVSRAGDTLRLSTRTGLEKVFAPLGDRWRLRRVQDASGNHLSFTYGDGRLSRIDNSSGRFVTIDRDGEGRIRRFADEQGREVFFAYDQAGRLATSTDLGGFEWEYVYAQDRLVAVIDPLDHRALRAAYGAQGRAASIDVRGRSFRFAYVGAETRVTDARGLLSTYRHDSSGRLVSMRNAAGVVSEIRRGKGGPRLLRDGAPVETHRQARPAVRFAHAETGDVAWLHQDGAPERRFTYDADGQVILALGDEAASFRYDRLGRMVEAHLAGGQAYRYTYDARGLRLSVTGEGERHDFGYDEAGRLHRIRWQRGEQSGGYDYELDTDNRIIALETLDGNRVEIDYDQSGNVVKYGERIYSYDVLDRLIAVSEPDGTELRRSYAPDEPGLLEAADRRTPTHAVDVPRASAVYGSAGEIFFTRGHGALAAGLRYDPASKTLRTFEEAGGPSSKLPIEVAMLRSKIDRLTRGATSTFNAGSNAFFLPPESRAVGCVMNCNIWSVTTSIAGSVGTTTVDAGVPATIIAFALAECPSESRHFRVDYTNNGSWDLYAFDPALLTFYTYSSGPQTTKVEAYCQCNGLRATSLTTVNVRHVTERAVARSAAEVMTGTWPNSSGTVSVPIPFQNTLREEYTVKETFINGSLTQRQILAGYSTLVTSPSPGFPAALPYDSISLLNARHRYRHPGATAWSGMGGPTSPIMIGPDSVFRQVTSSLSFPVGNTGSGEAEVESLALGGFPGVAFAYPLPSVAAGPNGLINDTTDVSMGF